VEVGIGNADIPGNQAMGADLDPFLGHDERAVEQSEIAHSASAILSDRERAAGINRDVIAKNNGAFRSAPEMTENLGALAVEAFAKSNVRRHGFFPPIVFDVPVALDVAHVG
jgi:hypothetical protein